MKDNKRNKEQNNNHYKFIIILLLIIICIMSLIFGLRGCSTTTPVNGNGVVWQGDQDLSTTQKTYYNKVIGFDKLHFTADTTKQKVNFYNDKSNQCYMEISLVLNDGTILWQSGELYPNNGFYEIELSQSLHQGVYENCQYQVRMFNIKTAEEVNPYTCTFTLYVQ